MRIGTLIAVPVADKEFDEDQHPRDEHGRFTDDGGSDEGRITAEDIRATGERPDINAQIVTTKAELAGAVLDARHEFQAMAEAHGAPPGWGNNELNDRQWVQAWADVHPENVPPEQRARAEEMIGRFMNDPKMQAVMEEYGKPTFIIANEMPNLSGAGDVLENGTLASWVNGTVTVYGSTSGNEEWLRENHVSTTPDDPKPFANVSASWGEGDATMRHEYGHQVGLTMMSENPGLGDEFKNVVIGVAPDAAPGSINQQDAVNNAQMSLYGISQYAMAAGPQEAFAEAFSIVTDPHYDRADATYPPESQAILNWVEDHTRQHTGGA